MTIKHGKDITGSGPGVEIDLTGDEVAIAIDAWLVAHEVYVNGPRTTSVNGALIKSGNVYVDPSGSVVYEGNRISGKGES